MKLMGCRTAVVLLLAGWAVPAVHAQSPTNLLRNGSFEGSTLYWHNVNPEHHKLVRGGAPAGEFVLRIEKEHVMSAPFAAQPGQSFTASFFVKADRDGEVHVQLPPSAREEGQRAKRLWVGEATQKARVGPQWQRVSFTAKADVPQSGFWPNPHYLVQIGGTVPIEVDGVSVNLGDAAPVAYQPRRQIEVLAECPDLKGYRADGNLFEKGATVTLIAHASNPTSQARSAILRCQLIDYEGRRPISAPADAHVTIPAGKTFSHKFSTKLTATGCVLARVSALDGGTVIDSSDLPLTSLPYPMRPRKPDPRERFGGSFFGPHTAGLGSRMGFAWSRWWPHTKWQDHQPDGPDSWRWFDKELDTLEGLGISAHLVLYGWPKWIMEEGKHPLPRDMRWPPNDPRWEDLSVETAWDKYIKTATAHYKGRGVIYEIENEPEFDKWDTLQDEYAKFTIRTARLIKQVDPKAKVMVNNVYGIPSGLNRRLLERGAARHIDIISWHDYHEGWLAEANAMKRMRAALDSLGGQHIEIWFNEGWAYTNTAVDEPMACTRLTSSQGTNAMVCSIAELTMNGQDKTILFHTGYEQHGMSFWDYSGPGTMLWDWYGFPLPLVAAWNTLAHHVGLSERVAFVRPEGANFCIFEDLRNGRGVVVAYADREAPSDASIELPLDGLTVEDAMGNATPLTGQRLTLPRNGRPVFVYDDARTTGKVFAEKLLPLDRKNASFVSKGGVGFRLPPTWEGTKKGHAAGNPAMAGGKPVWRLDQVWPPDPKTPGNYHPLVWDDNYWVPAGNSFGGQPKAEMRDRGIRLELRAAHSQPQAERICGLVFIAPQAGTVVVTGSAQLTMWEGNNPVRLALLQKTGKQVKELASLKLAQGKSIELAALGATVSAGDELVLLPRIEGAFNGGDVVLRDLEVRFGD